jgi:hypothetical protein
MIPWWKRLLFSLLSVALAALICEAYFIILEVFQPLEVFLPPGRQLQASEYIVQFGLVLVYSLPGWLFAIPIVLTVTDIGGWRFWVYWAIGSAIGPFLFLLVALCLLLSHPDLNAITLNVIPLILFGTAISCVTTLFYLLLLRRARASLLPSLAG